MIVILNNIRSSENVGSIFRTADAAGAEKVILVGYTPTPVDKFKRKNTRLSKAALGAEGFVPWEQFKSLKSASSKIKKEGYKVVAVEQDENSIDYLDAKKKLKGQKIALLFGNEVDGLSKKDLELCDYIAEIPMRGKKESLNVAVSAGVALYGLSS